MNVESTAGTDGHGRLVGRAAIVTGASQGIGEGIAKAFAKEGANLVLVGRTPEKLHSVAVAIENIGGSVVEVQGSVADRAIADRAVSEALAAFGRPDVLVNNAHSFSPKAPLDEISEAGVRLALDTGFFGTFYFMQAAAHA